MAIRQVKEKRYLVGAANNDEDVSNYEMICFSLQLFFSNNDLTLSPI
jgi:hypothetical protein